MRALVQRVSRARVEIGGASHSQIGRGLLLFLGVEAADCEEDVQWLAPKIRRMRIFPDEAGLMNRSVMDIGGEILVVSQFTLHAAVKTGNRPSFARAARPEEAELLYGLFVRALEKELGRPVATGRFAAHMEVALVNDGPVTIMIDSRRRE